MTHQLVLTQDIIKEMTSIENSLWEGSGNDQIWPIVKTKDSKSLDQM